MNVDEVITKHKLLEEENKKLQDELIQTKEHLKKYTAPSNMKKYYENHKVLNCYSNKIALPEIDNTFILYCIKSLGTRSNQGVKSKILNYLISWTSFIWKNINHQ